MKKQLFLALVLLCAGISLNAMSTDMETKKEEVVTPAIPAPVKEEVAPVVPAPVKEEAVPADEDFEIDMDSDVEEVE